jgi:hypothetical protein
MLRTFCCTLLPVVNIDSLMLHLPMMTRNSSPHISQESLPASLLSLFLPVSILRPRYCYRRKINFFHWKFLMLQLFLTQAVQLGQTAICNGLLGFKCSV